MQEETAVHLTHTEQQTTKHISLLLLHVHTVSVLLHGLLWSYSGLGCPPQENLGVGHKRRKFLRDEFPFYQPKQQCQSTKGNWNCQLYPDKNNPLIDLNLSLRFLIWLLKDWKLQTVRRKYSYTKTKEMLWSATFYFWFSRQCVPVSMPATPHQRHGYNNKSLTYETRPYSAYLSDATCYQRTAGAPNLTLIFHNLIIYALVHILPMPQISWKSTTTNFSYQAIKDKHTDKQINGGQTSTFCTSGGGDRLGRNINKTTARAAHLSWGLRQRSGWTLPA